MDPLIPLSETVALGFATPVLARRTSGFEPVNRALAAQTRAVMAADGGARYSNRGGWQSRPDFWDWPSSEVATWRGWVHDAILRMSALTTGETDLGRVDVRYEASAWVNVNRHGHYNVSHIHNECHWAVVYYVECGTMEPGWEYNGKIELNDPRTMAKASTLSGYGFRSVLFDPVPGALIVFPSWIEHSVHPFYGTGDRISIACNVRMTGGRHSGLTA